MFENALSGADFGRLMAISIEIAKPIRAVAPEEFRSSVKSSFAKDIVEALLTPEKETTTCIKNTARMIQRSAGPID